MAHATDSRTFGLVINTPVTVARYVVPGLTFNPARGFTPITLLYRTRLVVAVSSSLPVRTLPEFISHVRARPGQLTYASIGAGVAPHLGMEELADRHGMRMERAVYRGFPELTLDLSAGRIAPALTTVFGALPAMQEGKVRAHAVTSDRRSPLFPEVPTVAEAGEPAAEMYGWVGLVGPADLPPAHEIATVLREAIAIPAGRANLETQGAEFVGSTPDAFAEEIRRGTARWMPIIDRLGLRIVQQGGRAGSRVRLAAVTAQGDSVPPGNTRCPADPTPRSAGSAGSPSAASCPRLRAGRATSQGRSRPARHCRGARTGPPSG